jgi:protein-S-isoprenylcysteine O-methyltransferase Ste14
MYGLSLKSWPQRITIIAGECVFLLFVYWFLFEHGNDWFHLPKGDSKRNVMLFGFCLFTFIRMSFMVVYLLKRGVMWKEAGGVLFAFALYYFGFSVLGGVQDKPLNALDAIAVLLFVAGSAINTISEWLRDRWKRDTQNTGKLYTGGLFRYAVHINYFGDVVWVCGFALLTRSIWAWLMPLFLLSMFMFQYIPVHDRYLREKYGESFEAYEKKTKKLIPFIY